MQTMINPEAFVMRSAFSGITDISAAIHEALSKDCILKQLGTEKGINLDK